MKQNGLGRADAQLARLLKKRDDLEARIALARNEREEQVLARLRAAGVGRLSPAALDALIENIRAAEPSHAKASDHHDPEDLVEVRVRLSANTSRVNQGTLRAAGLRWNGKQARHIGRVSKATLARLIEQFPDRVEVGAAGAPAGGASPSTAVPTVQAPSVVAEPSAVPVPAADREANPTPSPAPPSTAAPTARSEGLPAPSRSPWRLPRPTKV